MTNRERTAGDLSGLEEASIADLQAMMQAGEITSAGLVDFYVSRINTLDQDGPRINSVLEVNPDAHEIAAALDEERRRQGPRGPLHGIPILLKDNIDTHDRMHTTAGSLALMNSTPERDAFLAARLREAGAVLLGKATLSEWANFRSTHSMSGWCGRAGQTRNPNVLDRSPGGSSSGSGAAAAAGFCAVAVGTETDGSILSPGSANGVVGIKPTVGLISRAGVIPISHTQNTAGPLARTVADAAALLGAMVGVDAADEATAASQGNFVTDYTQLLQRDALKGARIGVPRGVFTAYHPPTDAILEEALRALREAGAILVDPCDIPTADEMKKSDDETTVLQYDFKHDLNTYLDQRGDPEIRTLADLIAFNEAHADREMPYFGQELFLASEKRGPLSDTEYQEARARNLKRAREDGIDKILREHQLDALLMATTNPAGPIDLVNGGRGGLGASFKPGAVAGYPSITVPAGYCFDLPVGVSFVGTAWSEPTLIRLAFAFEQATKVRRPPRFLPTTPEVLRQ